MLTDIKLLQSSKANSPIVLTLAGILTDFKPWQWENAKLPILVQSSGMSTWPLALGGIAQLDVKCLSALFRIKASAEYLFRGDALTSLSGAKERSLKNSSAKVNRVKRNKVKLK
jgi:hypothetical protein